MQSCQHIKEIDTIPAVLFYKDKIHIVEKHQCGILWLKIKSDVFLCNEDLYVCNLYIPPHGSKVINTQDIDIYMNC